MLGVKVHILSFGCSLLGLNVCPLGYRSVEVFWFVVFRPVRFSVVSTHSTTHFGVRQGQRVLAQGIWNALLVEVFPIIERSANGSLDLKQY